MNTNAEFENLKNEYKELKDKYSERSFKIMAINQLTSTLALEKDVTSLKHIVSDMFFEVSLVNKALALDVYQNQVLIINGKNMEVETQKIDVSLKKNEFKYLIDKKILSIKKINEKNLLPEIFDNFKEGYCIAFDTSKGKEQNYYIIIIGEKSFGSYTEVDDEFLATISGQIRLILENAVNISLIENKNKELNETVFNLQVMNYASTLLSTTLELEDLLKYVSDIFFEIFEAKKLIIFNFNEDLNEFQIHSSLGYNVELEGLNIEVNEDYKFALLSSSDIKRYKNYNNDSFLQHLCEVIEMDENTYLVPFVSQHSIVGIAILYSIKKLDVEFFNTLKIQMAVAINNAKLYNSAITDGMTGVYNHIHFKRKLKKEMHKTTSTSLILLDIDNFKCFNDTYGHVLGDKVLIEIAKLLKETARKHDLVVRYGGEEFVLLLPETKLHDALIMAERLREEIERLKVFYDDIMLKVTASFGVSEYNKRDLLTLNEFVDNTDTALYESKRTGKNKVTVYNPTRKSESIIVYKKEPHDE